MWVRKLEKADGIMREPDEAVQNAAKQSTPAIDPFSRSTSFGERAATALAANPAAAKPATPAPRAPPSNSGRKRQAAGLINLAAMPATPPRLRSSVAMGRSVSSPCARSDAPSPPSQVLHPSATSNDPARALLRRRTIAQPDGSRADPSTSSNDRKRRRLTSLADKSNTALRSFASLPLSLYAIGSRLETTDFDSSSYAWSLYPPLPPGAVVPEPRNPHLSLSNYVESPHKLLAAAGLASAVALSTSKTVRDEFLRQGVIYVSPGPESDDFVRRLEEGACRAKQVAGQRATVWILKREGLKMRGGCDLGMGSDVLTVL